MLRFLIILVLAYVLYRLIRGAFSPSKEIYRGKNGAVIDEMVQDPFCKTYIPRRESIRKVIDGEEYFFCSETCADQFESERKG
jgi:uncharacterized protein